MSLYLDGRISIRLESEEAGAALPDFSEVSNDGGEPKRASLGTDAAGALLRSGDGTSTD